MKSRTKPALRALPAAQVQISLPVQGVLRCFPIAPEGCAFGALPMLGLAAGDERRIRSN